MFGQGQKRTRTAAWRAAVPRHARRESRRAASMDTCSRASASLCVDLWAVGCVSMDACRLHTLHATHRMHAPAHARVPRDEGQRHAQQRLERGQGRCGLFLLVLLLLKRRIMRSRRLSSSGHRRCHRPSGSGRPVHPPPVHVVWMESIGRALVCVTLPATLCVALQSGLVGTRNMHREFRRLDALDFEAAPRSCEG